MISRNVERGLTLLETLVALLLIALGLLAAAPMFVYAMQGNAVGADFGEAGAIAVERMERLREEPWDSVLLAVGGSLTSNVTTGGVDYFDNSDPNVFVRWLIEANAVPSDTKIVTVRVEPYRQVVGQTKQVTLSVMRGE